MSVGSTTPFVIKPFTSVCCGASPVRGAAQQGVNYLPATNSVRFDADGKLLSGRFERNTLSRKEKIQADENTWLKVKEVFAKRISNLSEQDIWEVIAKTVYERLNLLDENDCSRPTVDRLTRVIRALSRLSYLKSAETDTQDGGVVIDSSSREKSKAAFDAKIWAAIEHNVLSRFKNLTAEDLRTQPYLQKIKTVNSKGETRADGVRPSAERINEYVYAALAISFTKPENPS